MTPKFERRTARILSDNDVKAIADAVVDHQNTCKFTDIKPEDLRAMIESHHKFNLAMDDSRKVVRRFCLVLILTGISGYAVYGWWSKIIDSVKKALPS